MSELRSRPMGNYIKIANWQELYILTTHWKSDLLFYRDDLKFMRHLIDKYFNRMIKSGNMDAIEHIGLDILEDTHEYDLLLEKVERHLDHLIEVIAEPFKYDTKAFRNEHQDLEDEIALFIKAVRENRRRLFKVTEHILEKG